MPRNLSPTAVDRTVKTGPAWKVGWVAKECPLGSGSKWLAS
jgi:hypothetical protein